MIEIVIIIGAGAVAIWFVVTFTTAMLEPYQADKIERRRRMKEDGDE